MLYEIILTMKVVNLRRWGSLDGVQTNILRQIRLQIAEVFYLHVPILLMGCSSAKGYIPRVYYNNDSQNQNSCRVSYVEACYIERKNTSNYLLAQHESCEVWESRTIPSFSSFTVRDERTGKWMKDHCHILVFLFLFLACPRKRWHIFLFIQSQTFCRLCKITL